MRTKQIVVLLVLLGMVASNLTAMPASAQTSKPSVPEFTLKLVPGLPETNQATIELTIKNQPFDKDAVQASFVYNVRIKKAAENWTDLYNAEDGYPAQSNSSITVLTYVLGESAYYPPEAYPLSPSMRVGVLPTSGQVDFQVEAMIGRRDRGVYSNGMMPYVFIGERSGWSTTQTITIPNGSSTPAPTETIVPEHGPTSPPVMNEGLFGLGWEWVLLAVAVAALVVVVVLQWRGRK